MCVTWGRFSLSAKFSFQRGGEDGRMAVTRAALLSGWRENACFTGGEFFRCFLRIWRLWRFAENFQSITEETWFSSHGSFPTWLLNNFVLYSGEFLV